MLFITLEAKIYLIFDNSKFQTNFFSFDLHIPLSVLLSDLHHAPSTDVSTDKKALIVIPICPKGINALVVYPIAPFHNVLIPTVDDDVSERLELLELHLMTDVNQAVFIH